MKEILIINGSGGVGKDTFVSCLAKYAKVEHSSIAKLPKAMAALAGWKGTKTEEDRKFLSDLKILVDNYNDKCYKFVERLMKEFKNGETDADILCVDMREKEQIERARKEFGAKTILVKRDSVAPIKTNIADANVEAIEYDYTIHNNGTIADLEEKAKTLLSLLKEEADENDFKGFEKTVYISYPVEDMEKDKEKIEEIISELMEIFPNYQFVSPLHAFGFHEEYLSNTKVLAERLWLLSNCDEMWIYGVVADHPTVKLENEFCSKKGIPHGRIIQMENGAIKLVSNSSPLFMCFAKGLFS